MKKILLISLFVSNVFAYDATDQYRNKILERIATALEKIANQKPGCPQQSMKTEIVVKDESWKQYPRSAGKNRPNLKAEPTLIDEKLDACTTDCLSYSESLQNACLQKCIDLYQ